MKSPVKIEAYVLAGGKSSRMGQDKGRISFQGKPMISYVLEVLQRAGLPVTIIANDKAYESFGYPVIPDIVKEKGPMGGLLTALRNTSADQILLVSCDMPFVQEDLILSLLDMGSRQTIVVPEVEGKIYPMPGIYPLEVLDETKKHIESGRLKMKDFISENRHTLVPSGAGENLIFFRNINTVQELKEAEERWKKLR